MSYNVAQGVFLVVYHTMLHWNKFDKLLKKTIRPRAV